MSEPLPLLDLVEAHTARMVATTRALRDTAAPSLCEGWTRSHVATHVARNAEAIHRLAAGAARGEPVTMYPDDETRDAEVEAGSGRDAATLAEDLERTAADLAPALAALPAELADTEVERTPGGRRFRVGALPFMRLREVVLHHVDLDAGFTLDDVEDEALLALLEDAVARLRASERAPSLTIRTDAGDVFSLGEGDAHVTGGRAGVLLWLARRIPDHVRSDRLPDLPRGT